MSIANPVVQLRIIRDQRQADAAIDGALLKQTGLLATLITSRREADSEPFLGQAELMRLVKSQQSLLAAVPRIVQPEANAWRPGLNEAAEAYPALRRAA